MVGLSFVFREYMWPPGLVLIPLAGYVVGSLALIADAYHMLNDAMSLVIALYAIKVLFFLRIFLLFMGSH